MKNKLSILFALSALCLTTNKLIAQEQETRESQGYVVQGRVSDVILVNDNEEGEEEDDIEIIIPDTTAESRLWLDFFQENGQLLSFEKLLDWEIIDDTAIMASKEIVTYDNTFSDNIIDVPQGNMGISSLYNLDFSNNELVNVDFMISLSEIRGDVNFENNLLRDLNGLYFINNIGGNAYFHNNNLNSATNLLNLQSIGGELTLYNNSNLKSLYGLRSITSGVVRIDNPSQYETKVDFYSDFCQSFNDGAIEVYVGETTTRVTKSEVCNADPWLNFLQDNGQLSGFDNLSEWENELDFSTASLNNFNFTNFDLPSFPLSVTSLYELDFSNNQLTNLDFFEPIERVRGNASFNNNFIRNVEILEKLTIVDSDLNLADNGIRSLVGLENLTEVNRLFINNNPITSLEPIQEIFDIRDLYIDEVTQYEKIPYTTPLCTAFINNVLDIVIADTGLNAEESEICDGLPDFTEWLAFFQGYGQLGDLNSIFDWILFDDFANVGNQNINNATLSDLPETMGVYSIFGLDMSQNDLTNVNFLGSLREVRTNLYLQSNNLIFISGLSQLESVKVLDLSKNNNLNDIRGISNLINADRVVFDNPQQYQQKPVYSSGFCQALNTGSVLATTVDSEPLSAYNLCSEIPNDEQWRLFFVKNNQFTSQNSLNDWTSTDIEVRINRNYQNSEFPNVVMPISSIHSLFLNSNQLSNLNFMSEVTEVRGEFNIRNNNISDISGLANIATARVFDLSDNNISDISMLTLSSVETLNLSLNSSLTDISVLNNLLEATKVVLNNPAQYTVKPNVNSQFCTNVLAGSTTLVNEFNIEIEGTAICEGVRDNSAAWLYFFQSKNQLLELNDLNEWGASGLTAELNFESLDNGRVPSVNMGVEEIHSLDFSNNNFTSLGFLNGVKSINGDLLMNNNFVQNVSAIGSLTTVEGKIDLSFNAFSIRAFAEESPITNLRNVKELSIYSDGSTLVEEIRGLKNITGRTLEDPTIVRIDDPARYRSNHFRNRIQNVPRPGFPDTRVMKLLDFNTEFCLGIVRGTIELYVGAGSEKAQASLICDGIPDNAAWLEYFKAQGQLLSFLNLEEWQVQNELADVSNLGITNDDLPSGSMELTSLFSLDMSDNALTNVVFMAFVDGVRGDLDLSNNNIESLSGLEQLTFVNGVARIYGNNYDTLINLRNLVSAPELRVDVPNELEKLSYSWPICKAIEEGNVVVYEIEGTIPLPLSRVCFTADTDPNTAWLNFFKNNNQLTTFVDLVDWETTDSLADISGLDYSNADLPNSLMRISQLDSANFSNNRIANAFFLNNITEVRGTLDLSNNRLSNVGGLSNLAKADILNISGNSSVISIQSLSELGNSREVTMDSPTQYTTKPDTTSVFCEAVKRKTVNAYDLTRRLSMKDVCTNVPAEDQWLSFFQAEHNTLNSLAELSEWSLKNGVASIIGDQNIDNSALPSVDLPAPSIYALAISGQNLSNIDFLNQVTEVRNELNFSDNAITDITGLQNITGKIPTLNLSGNQLISVSSLSGASFDDIDLSNNQLTDTAGLDFSTINNLFLNNNQLVDVNTLVTLTNIDNEMNVTNNPLLTDITGVQNIVSGKIIIDSPVQYTTKPDFSTPFCQAILANTVTVEDINTNERIYVEDICVNVSDQGLWLSYFHREGRLLELGNINEWTTQDGVADLPNINVTNNDLPTGQIGVTSLFTLDFSNNQLDNLDFLTGLSEVRGSLRLNNNPLISTTGLADLRDVTGDLLLNDTNLTSTQELIRLRNIGTLDLAGNDNLLDLSGLENIEFASAVLLNDPVQYNLIDFTSPFCFGVSRGEVVPTVKETSQRILITDICDGVPNEARWLNYLQVNGQLLGFTEMADWETLDTFATLANKGLNNGEIPSARMITTGIYSFDMSNNVLRNISFLALVTEIREEINFNNNRIDNIGGLARVINAKNIRLANNNIEDLSRMESIQTLQLLDISNNPILDNIGALRGVTGTTYLDMSGTAIRTLVPIEDFTSLTFLDISNTPLTDITPLADLSIDVVNVPDPTQIENKPEFSTSTFCQDYFNGLISVRYNGTEVYVYDICANVPSDIAWLDFFKREGQLLTFSSFGQWTTQNIAANVSANSIENGRLPPTSFGINSIFGLDFNTNNLTNVDFLIDVQTQRQNLLLQNNQITDFSGLNGLVTVIGDLDISNNPMTEFNPTALNSVNNILINQNNDLTNINLNALNNIGANLEIFGNPLLTTINNTGLSTVGGLFDIYNNDSLGALDLNAATYNGIVTINNNNAMTDLTINNANFGANLVISNNDALTTLNQLSFDSIVGDYEFNNNNAITEFNFNSVGTLGGAFDITNNNLLETINIQTVPSLGRDLNISGNPALTTIVVNDIQDQVAANIGINVLNNNALTDLTVNNMRFIKGNFNVNQNNNLQNVTLGNVERIFAQFLLNNMPALETITLGTIGQIDTNILADNNPLLTDFVATNLNTVSGLINLQDNPALTTLDLGLTTRIVGNLNLENSTALTDVTGLSNLGTINGGLLLSDPTQYTTRPDYNVPFCIGITASDIIPRFNNGFVSITNLCDNVPNHALWMDIFHSYNQMRDADTIFDWELETNTSNVNISGNSLSESDFPAFPLDSTKIYIFNISNNQFTQLDILANLQEIRHSFIANNNLINDISNLSNITRIEQVLDLSNNRLISTNGFIGLTYVGQRLSLQGNSSLNDLSGLQNIAFAPRVELDSPEQFTTRMPATSPFCQALVRQEVTAYVGNTNEKIAMRFLCENSDSQDLWLNLFHTYNQLLSFTDVADWELNNQTGDISNKGLNTPDLPINPIATTSVFTWLMNDNGIANLDFMSNITNVRNTANFANNNINDISGLQNITNYINLYLQNNMISDPSPLDNIQTGLVNLDLSLNDILRTPTLTNFANLNNVYFNGNINLEDISGLSALRNVNQLYLDSTNITDITPLRNLVTANEIRFDNPTGITPKLDYIDPFCDGIKNDIILPYFNSGLIDIRELCTNFTDDYLWLLFFRDNGQVTNYNDISEWETNDGVVTIASGNLQNQDLPPNLIGVSTLFTLDMNTNFIENLNFMSGVTTVRNTINFSNNSLNDISGLSNITSVLNVYLNDNPNLGDISSLSTLSTINDLNIANTGRTSFAGLDSLTDITGTFDIRNNPLLTDLTFLNQIITANAIELDDPVQYTPMDYFANPICVRINDGDVAIFNNGERLSADKICDPFPSEFDWLAFYKTFDKNNSFVNYFTLQQWTTTNTTADVSSLGLTPAQLPNTGDLGVGSIYGINFENNQIDTVNWMNGVTTVRGALNFSLNNLTDLTGLEGITTMADTGNVNKNIELASNQLTNVDGLANLTELGSTYHDRHAPYGGVFEFRGSPGTNPAVFDLRNNQLTNVDGLSSLTNLTYANLLIQNNPQLTDISGLRNLQNITYLTHRHCNTINRTAGRCNYSNVNHFHYLFVDNTDQYTVRPESDSAFCTAVKNSNVIVLLGSDNSRVEVSKLCNVEDPWLTYIQQDHNQLLWDLFPTEVDAANDDIDLSAQGLTDLNIPQVNMEFTNLYTLRMNDNNITNVNFLTNVTRVRNLLDLKNNNITDISGLSNITNAHNIDLSNNDILDVSPLLNLTNITSDLVLHSNENISDITGIQNIANTNGARIVIDSQTQYTVKPLIDTPLCQGLFNGTVRLEVFNTDDLTYTPLSDREFCDASQAWLDFLQINGQALSLTDINQLATQTTPIDISGNNYADTDRPNGALNVATLLNFNFADNAQTEIGYLLGLEELTGDVNFANNSLINIDGLDQLRIVGGSVILNDNALTDINGLQRLQSVTGNIDIAGNTNLVDITGLSDILTVGGSILIDEPAQYIVKPDVSSSFCGLVASDSITVTVKDTARNVDVNELCSATDEWLGFFHEQAVLLDNLVLSDWNTDTLNIDVSNRSLTNATVPASNIDLTEVYGFNIGDNGLTDIDFMSQITRADDLNFVKNNLSNINGLANLTNVTKVLAIQENRSITDLSQLGNLVEGTIYINNPDQYTTKPNVSTAFCTAIRNTTVRPEDVEEGQEILRIGDLCSTTDVWMTYFYDQGVMSDYAYITDMETQSVVIDLSERALTDAQLPNAAWNVMSIYDVNLKSNNLTDIDFLGGIEDVRESLDVSLNNLNNLNGLFSITIAKDLFFNGNNLTDISGLINLAELTGFLYLTGNPNLTNISFLEELQRNNPLFPVYLDDPSQYTIKPAIGSNFCQALDSGFLTVIGLVNGTQPEDDGVIATPLTSTELCQ